MINIKRAVIPHVLNLEDEESDGAKEHENALLHFQVKDRDFKFTAYKKDGVKEALELMFNKKCAYCESLLNPVSYGDIEHFRPKSAYHVKASDPLTYPGYYWLAMNWSNLLLACEKCNRKYKKNLFPLADEANRQKRHDYLVSEEPLLIDPCDENTNPLDYIRFRNDGTVYGLGNKGEISILTYGLYNRSLTESRRIVAKDIEDKKAQSVNYLNIIKLMADFPPTNERKKIFEDIIQDLKNVYDSLIESIKPSSPYSGMAWLLTEDFFNNHKLEIEKLLKEFKFILK